MARDELTPYDRRILDGAVGKFGEYLMGRSYDEGMRSAERTLAGKWKAESSQRLTQQLAGLNAEQHAAVLELVQEALVSALHGFLHGLSHDEDRIRVLFDGHDVADESDGLQGDLFLFLQELSAYPYVGASQRPAP